MLLLLRRLHGCGVYGAKGCDFCDLTVEGVDWILLSHALAFLFCKKKVTTKFTVLILNSSAGQKAEGQDAPNNDVPQNRPAVPLPRKSSHFAQKIVPEFSAYMPSLAITPRIDSYLDNCCIILSAGFHALAARLTSAHLSVL
jgi:hypothetical protein